MPRPSVLDPTHARPEPWFVGSGRGLMTLVLLTCAILIMARAAQIILLAESAWLWWRTEPAAQTSEPPAPRPLALAMRSTNAAAWFGPDDYPAASIRAEEEGTTRIAIRFTREGMPKTCRIVRSSGHARLDRATCNAVRLRATHDPVSSRAAEPVTVKTVHWRLPTP